MLLRWVPSAISVIGQCARIHAGTAEADLPLVTDHPADHQLDVVEALRNLLASLRAGHRVAHEEHAYFVVR